jgi:hypothetical protein
MSSEVEIDEKQFESIIDRLDKFGNNVSRQDILLQLAQKAKDIVFLRTFQHKDINGNPFKPYNAKYAEKKGVGKEAVNLYSQTMGNHMLNDMAARVLNNDAGEVYFRSREKAELASMHNTGDIRGNKQREFFGISNLELEGLVKDYNDIVQREIKELKLA